RCASTCQCRVNADESRERRAEMGAFNTVTLSEPEICAACDESIHRRIQFKFGDTWQYEYVIGETLAWGGNQIGVRAHLVQVLGYGEGCSNCRARDEPGVYDILVRDGEIVGVAPGREDAYVAYGAGYIVLEP